MSQHISYTYLFTYNSSFNRIDFISDYQKLLLYIELSNNDYILPYYSETQDISNYDRLFITEDINDINLLKQDLNLLKNYITNKKINNINISAPPIYPNNKPSSANLPPIFYS